MVVVHGFSCSAACGIFPDQALNSVCPALAGGFLTTDPLGNLVLFFLSSEVPAVAQHTSVLASI